MEERRRRGRGHLVFYIRILHEVTGNFIGHLVNINSIGLMVISRGPMELGDTMPLKMRMPKGYRGKNELHFRARVVWCSGYEAELHRVGFQITQIDPGDAEAIDWLVGRFGFDENFFF